MDTRLKEVRQTDLTEGRINQEFLDWLQTKGMSWLLVLLVGVCIYLGFVRWKSHQSNTRAEAWKTLQESRLPSALEKAAEDYAGVDNISALARNIAAGQLMTSVESGQAIGATDTATPQPLTAEEREKNLDRADKLYAKVIEGDDGSLGMTLLVVQAMNGRAAVAESRGKADEAKVWYEKAATRAEKNYPALAEQARQRATSVVPSDRTVTFPPRDERAEAASQMPERQPIEMDQWARDLLLPPAKPEE